MYLTQQHDGPLACVAVQALIRNGGEQGGGGWFHWPPFQTRHRAVMRS